MIPFRFKNKYRNKPVRAAGVYYASKKEYRRHQELLLEERAGLISNLKTQVNFKLMVKGTLVCTYRADFVYIREAREIVEDSKGFLTPEFKLKRKLFNAIFGRDILIT